MNRWLTTAFGLATFRNSSPSLASGSTGGGLDLVRVGFEYVERCSGIDLDGDDCLVSTVLGAATSTGSGGSRRGLREGGCVPPDYGDEIFGLFAHARERCADAAYSPEQYEARANEILSFLGAESCWISLCDGTVDETFWTILYGEIAACAGVEIDAVDPCLWTRTIGVIASDEMGEEFDDDDSAGGNFARRALRTAGGDPTSDACRFEVPEAELAAVLGPWLAEAGRRCERIGEGFGQNEVDVAYAAFAKLLSAPPKCLDQEQISDECNDIPLNVDKKSKEEIDSSFADFVRLDVFERLLGCAFTQEPTCVLSKSVELLMGTMQSCTAPVIDESGIIRIADKAMTVCSEEFAPVADNDEQDAIDYLMTIVSQADCWEGVCGDQHAILDDWMMACSLNDLGFLYSDLEFTESIADGEYEMPLAIEMLKCMVDYIIVQKVGDADGNRECSMNQLGPNVCGTDSSIGLAAFAYCFDEPTTSAPSPDSSPMSYSLEFNGAYEISMSYNYNDDDKMSNVQAYAYVSEVCHLLESIQYNPVVKDCMQPMCEIDINDVLATNYVGMPPSSSPTLNPTLNPTASPTSKPTLGEANFFPSPTSEPTLGEANFIPSPTSEPTSPEANIIPSPTSEPTSKPTVKPTTLEPSAKPANTTPTARPTKARRGSIDVKFDIAVTLAGIKSLDFNTLGSVISLLERVFLPTLPENSKIRLLKFAGVPVARRMLQSLEESGDGVQVEFEVIVTKQCGDAACTNYKDISALAYDYVTADLKAKVENGSLSKAIQEEADAEGLSELASVSVVPDSLKANMATITVRTMSADTDDDEYSESDYEDDSASPTYNTALSILVVFSLVLMFQCFG